MKILILSDDFPPEVAGGAGVMAFRLSRELARQDNEVLVFSATQDIKKVGLEVFEGMKIRRFYSKYHERWRSYISLWNPKALKELRRTISEFKPDVIHAHNIHAHISYAALSIAKTSGAKVFMTAHDIMSFYPGTFTEFINPNDLSRPQNFNYRVSAWMMLKKFKLRYNPLRNFFIRYFLNKIDRVIAVSEELEDALSQNGIKHVAVIKNGIDVSSRSPNVEAVKEFKERFGIEGSEIVLFGGRLSGSKGGDLILLAMQKVVEIVPLAKLIVAGKKDFYAQKMEQKIRSLGISGNVLFTGWLDEEGMKKAYASASVVVTPSVCFDSFPNTNLEAFAAGKPAVATCFGGSKEVVRDNENGYVVNPFDIKNLSDKISELISDTNKTKKFGENGRVLVMEKFSIEKMAERYLSQFVS